MKKYSLLFALLLTTNFCFTQNFNGFAIYNQQGSSTTYLIDENQNIAHTWTMPTECNYTVQLKHNGNLVRGTKLEVQIIILMVLQMLEEFRK